MSFEQPVLCLWLADLLVDNFVEEIFDERREVIGIDIKPCFRPLAHHHIACPCTAAVAEECHGVGHERWRPVVNAFDLAATYCVPVVNGLTRHPENRFNLDLDAAVLIINN